DRWPLARRRARLCSGHGRAWRLRSSADPGPRDRRAVQRSDADDWRQWRRRSRRQRDGGRVARRSPRGRSRCRHPAQEPSAAHDVAAGGGAKLDGLAPRRQWHRLVAVKGAPEEVLRGSVRWLTADGEAELDGASRRRILSANDRMADEGMRVLGLALKSLNGDAEAQWDGLTWIGL